MKSYGHKLLLQAFYKLPLLLVGLLILAKKGNISNWLSSSTVAVRLVDAQDIPSLVAELGIAFIIAYLIAIFVEISARVEQQSIVESYIKQAFGLILATLYRRILSQDVAEELSKNVSASDFMQEGMKIELIFEPSSESAFIKIRHVLEFELINLTEEFKIYNFPAIFPYGLEIFKQNVGISYFEVDKQPVSNLESYRNESSNELNWNVPIRIDKQGKRNIRLERVYIKGRSDFLNIISPMIRKGIDITVDNKANLSNIEMDCFMRHQLELVASGANRRRAATTEVLLPYQGVSFHWGLAT